jgi:uncharacterized protein (DUF302 family)
VALGGTDHRTGGGPARRRVEQTVQKIVLRFKTPPVKLRVQHEKIAMLIKLTSDKCVSETAAALHAAVQANHFGVMQVHNLKETMAKKGVEFEGECLVFDVCQPQQAKKVLHQNMSVSTALPCRISIYNEGGKAILGTLKPTTLLAMFNAPQLQRVAQEVEDTIVKIMDEAVSG